MTTVVIADDHEVVRKGLRVILRMDPKIQLVGEAADGVEALRLVEMLRPDVLLVDLMMPKLNGLEVVREVRCRSPHTRSIVLTMHSDETHVVNALRSGAAGYVLKDAQGAEMLQAIQHVTTGNRYLSPALSQRAIDAYLEKAETSKLDVLDTLSSREREILSLAAAGLTSAEIASKLFISTRTVETHRANVMRKIGLRTHTDLVLFAVRRGILNIDDGVTENP